MQISKKLYTTLIVTILAISTIIAAVPMVSAEIVGNPTLTPTSGAIGTQVTVSNGATGASPFSTVTVYLDALAGQVLGSGSALADGSYSIVVTIPPTTAGDHYLVVNDGETESAGEIFTVTPRLVLNSIPAVVGTPTGLPGDQMTVVGDGFAGGDDITLTFVANSNASNTFTITTPAITSDANGSFSATITIPASVTIAMFDTYTVTAEDEVPNSASDEVVIDYYITATPSSGPTGITTTIAGRIAPSVAYAIRFNGATIASGTTSADGSYSTAYTIPAVLSTGAYTVDVLWATTLTRDTTFTVSPSPTITLSTNTGIVGATVGITGTGFSNLANITLHFGSTMINGTDMGFGPTNSTGEFDLTFVVPNQPVGVYGVTVADQYGATSASGVFFTITPTPVLVIETRAMEYTQGDQMSIYTWANMAPSTAYALKMTDPSGNVLATGTIDAGDWVMISANNYMVPYTNLGGIDPEYTTLPADAPVGAWNFTAMMGTTIVDTNLFVVSAPTGLADVMEGIANVTDDISDLSDDIADLSGEITDISGDVATVKTDVGQVKTLVGNLDITSLTGDLATIQSDLGTLTMDVAQLDAVVTAVAGDVAQVWTKVGTIEGKVTSIEGNTATIETDVGTLQADISDVKSNVDSTPAWIAVVLALVAAVAAIFAVITIRQKIAG